MIPKTKLPSARTSAKMSLATRVCSATSQMVLASIAHRTVSHGTMVHMMRTHAPLRMNALEKNEHPLGGLKKALRPFSAELPKSDSDTCFGQFDSYFPAVSLTFGL